MNTDKKKLLSTLSILTFLSLIIFAYINSTNAYAENNDAPVNTTNTQITTQASNRKAPVSINVYSDVVTESADTYDYSNKTNITNESTSDITPATYAPITELVVATITPSSTPSPDTEQAVTPAPDVPQGTGSPDATPEPDIITYPPTVAPAYTD